MAVADADVYPIDQFEMIYKQHRVVGSVERASSPNLEKAVQLIITAIKYYVAETTAHTPFIVSRRASLEVEGPADQVPHEELYTRNISFELTFWIKELEATYAYAEKLKTDAEKKYVVTQAHAAWKEIEKAKTFKLVQTELRRWESRQPKDPCCCLVM